MKSILGQLLNGRYLVVRQLIQKPSHNTYLAEDQHKIEHGQCLIKQYRLSNIRRANSLQTSRKFKIFLFREIQKIRKFNNYPQIPAVLDYFLWGEEFYFIREFIKGETLEEEIGYRQLEEADVLHLIQETLTILDTLHQVGKKHLNLKPSNMIFAAGSQKLFIADFDHLENLLQEKIVKSNVIAATSVQHDYYLAPEQKAGKPEISSDFYALGTIAIRALTGKYPHEVRLSDLDNYARASIVDIETSQTININSQLAKVLQNLISRDPQSRYQSAQAILQSLAKSKNVVFLPSPYTDAPNNSAEVELTKPLTKQKKKRKKSRLLSIIFGILALLSLIVSGLMFTIGSKTDPYQNFTEYRNEDYNITLKYPQAWTVRELEDPITGGIAVFTSPLKNELDTFQEQIYISIDNVSTTPEEYGEAIINKVYNNSNITDIAYTKETVELANQSAQSITYQRSKDNVSLKQKEIFIIKNNRVYLITCVAEKKNYQEFIDTVNQIVKTFTIEN